MTQRIQFICACKILLKIFQQFVNANCLFYQMILIRYASWYNSTLDIWKHKRKAHIWQHQLPFLRPENRMAFSVHSAILLILSWGKKLSQSIDVLGIIGDWPMVHWPKNQSVISFWIRADCLDRCIRYFWAETIL